MLTKLRNSQIAGRTLSLGVPMRVFPEEINILLFRLSKEYYPHQCKWASSKMLRALREQENKGMESLLFL